MVAGHATALLLGWQEFFEDGISVYADAEVLENGVPVEINAQTNRRYPKWSDLAIGRTTSCLLSLFSLVVLLTHRLQPDGKVPVLTAAWYEAFAQFCELCAKGRVG